MKKVLVPYQTALFVLLVSALASCVFLIESTTKDYAQWNDSCIPMSYNGVIPREYSSGGTTPC